MDAIRSFERWSARRANLGLLLLRLAVGVFLGPPAIDLPLRPHEPPRWMRAPIEVLVLVCLLVGVLPQWAIGAALELAARPVVGGAMPVYSLAIWHGVNKPLLMSLVALAGGVALFLWGRRRLTAGRQGRWRRHADHSRA